MMNDESMMFDEIFAYHYHCLYQTIVVVDVYVFSLLWMMNDDVFQILMSHYVAMKIQVI